MLRLNRQDIETGCQACDWRDALSQACAGLERAGRVSAAYRDGLLAREAQSSTYLGQGIAIPHGTPESRQHVRETGIQVLQFPEGVTWHDGARVHLLVAIAAQSDEHLDILRQLIRILDREGLGETLARADDPQVILDLLSRPPVTARFDATTLCTRLEVQSVAELVQAGAARLLHLQCVGPDYLAQVARSGPVALGQGLWLIQSGVGVKTPALALATPIQPFTTEAGPVSGVFCLAGTGEATRSLLERIDALLASGTGAELAGLPRDEVLARLAGEQAGAETVRVHVLNAHGLHARPAKQLVQVARAQPVPVRLRLLEGDGEAVSASSLTKVIGLGARRGQTLVVSASGEGAGQAVRAVAEAITEGLGEPVQPWVEQGEEARVQSQVGEPQPAPEPDQPLRAVPASPGLAIAPIFVVQLPDFQYPDRAGNPGAENERLDAALAEAQQQLEGLERQAEGGEAAQILSVHAEMLQDTALREAAQESIAEGQSAEAGWWHAIDTAARAQEALADRLLAERAADLRDVGRRVLGILCGVTMPEPPEGPYILVAEDIGPSDVARLDTGKVRGLVTARGGATSHSAILARALGIPAVVGAGESILALASGTDLIIDGNQGIVVPDPSPDRRQQTEARIRRQRELERVAYEQRHDVTVTADGHRVEVCANLGNTAHARDAVERGAEGVGLLRTEFIFMAHASEPDLDTQLGEYREAFDALDGLPLVARTLDVGGDKPLAYWPLPEEENPFLGLRGLRLSLTRPEILETQLRAMLVAAGSRPLRIMFPMVKDLQEFRAGKAIFDRIQAEVQAPDVQLGVMVEVPSCAVLASTLAPEVDFFSVGTNDLTQYTLAIDRGHPSLSAQADGLHPAVLALIRMTVQAAHRHGRWVGVCGELGSDPQAIPVLVGLGVDELSVTSRRVPLVKARIRQLTLPQCLEAAERALQMPTAQAVREALEDL